MENIVREYMDKFGKDRTHKRRYACLLGVLALLVCLAVFWRLKLVGTAMTNEAACGLQEHTHTDECYEDVLICGIATGETAEGAEHEHTADCYQRQLVCDIPEHTHTPDCYSDAEADTETEADWAASFPQEALTGDWAQDTVLVAASQAGYTESTRNWQLADDGTRRGYTRYGAWYGNPYGDWNGMFAAFCLHYAGVDDTYLTAENAAGVNAWAVSLFNAGEWQGPDHEAVPGDVVFFGSDDKIESCAIVTDVYDENGVPTLSVLAGDVDNAVAELTIPTDSGSILGYAATADAYAAYEADHPANDTVTGDEAAEEVEGTEDPEQTEETAEDKLVDTLEAPDETTTQPTVNENGLNLADYAPKVELTTKADNKETSEGFDRSKSFSFAMNYTVTSEQLKDAGYKAYYDLPDDLVDVLDATGLNTGSILNSSNKPMGTYEIERVTDTDGKEHYRFKFTYDPDKIDEAQNFNGTFKFQGKVGQTVSNEEKKVKIKFPGVATEIPITMKDGKVSGKKTHTLDKDTNELVFTVPLEVTGQSAKLELKDILGTNLAFADDPEFTFKNLTTGEVTNLEIQTTESGFTYTFENLPIGKYELTYRVKIKDVDKLPNTVNRIEWTWSHGSQGEHKDGWNDNINFTQGGLEKSGKYDKDTGEITWYIQVKPSELSTVANVVLTDTLTSDNHAYVDGWTICTDKNDIGNTTVAQGTDAPFDENHHFDFSRIDKATWVKGQTYYFVYKTKPTDSPENDNEEHVYKNKVEDNKEHGEKTSEVKRPADASGDTTKLDIVHKYVQTLPDDNMAQWIVQVDASQYLTKPGEKLSELTFTDTLRTAGQYGTQAKFVTDENGKVALRFKNLDGTELNLQEGVDYTYETLETDDYGIIKFSVKFKEGKIPQAPFMMIYCSQYDDAHSHNYWEKNTVHSDYELNGKTYGEDDEANIEYGAKGCGISKTAAITGDTIKWTITVDLHGQEYYRLRELGTYQIVDILPAGVTYKEGSALCRKQIYGSSHSNGDFTQYPDGDIKRYTTEDGRQKLVFDIVIDEFSGDKNWAEGELAITFETTIDEIRPTENGKGYNYTEEVISQGSNGKDKNYVGVDSYTNQATFGKDGKEFGTAEATASVSTSKLLKHGYDTGKPGISEVKFEITVNADAEDLNADSDTIDLYDVMEDFMSLDTEQGITIKDNKTGRMLGSDEFAMQYGRVDGKNQLKLTLPDATSLTVAYYARIYGEENVSYTLKNEAWLEGSVRQKVEWTDNYKIKASSASLDAIGLTFTKVDGTTLSCLPGAEFTLEKYADGTWETAQKVGPTKADGTVYVDELEEDTLYRLIETKSPEGYKLDLTPYYFVLQGKDSAKTAEYIKNVSDAAEGAAIKQLPNGMNVNISNMPVTGIQVRKEWTLNGEPIIGTDDRVKSITVELQYKAVKKGSTVSDDETAWTPADKTVLSENDSNIRELNANNNWYGTWENLAKNKKTDDGTIYNYYYRVVETTTGYTVSYKNDDGISKGEIIVTNNIDSYELPKTGGRGTLPYMAGGLALMAVSLLCAIYRKRKSEGRQSD